MGRDRSSWPPSSRQNLELGIGTLIYPYTPESRLQGGGKENSLSIEYQLAIIPRSWGGESEHKEGEKGGGILSIREERKDILRKKAQV